MSDFIKYPRTQHISGSRLQTGDHDLSQVPIESLIGKYIVVEEKMDGSNTGISFTLDDPRQANLPPDEQMDLYSPQMILQSRGSIIGSGPREAQYNLFKQWANIHRDWLEIVLYNKYIMYGEWLYSKHTVFYDQLPHYWMEFDVYDKEKRMWLDTNARRRLLTHYAPNGPIVSVKVLFEGVLESKEQLLGLIGPSHFISHVTPHVDRHAENLKIASGKQDFEQVKSETDMSGLMEGLYIKVEEDGQVKERYKYVRADFVQSILESESHWADRPIIPNRLADGVDIYG